MSRSKRGFDEDHFDEYALYDDRIRGDLRQRLEDVPQEDQDYGSGPGFGFRIGQSPRSPSVRGDDEIRPSRRRAASPDDGDDDRYSRLARRIGDDWDFGAREFRFDEPVPAAPVKRALLEGRRPVLLDYMFKGLVGDQPDSIVTDDSTGMYFLRSQRPVGCDARFKLNTLQLRGVVFELPISESSIRGTPDLVPQCFFVEVVVLYDRFTTKIPLADYNKHNTLTTFSWSDAFDRPPSSLTLPAKSILPEYSFNHDVLQFTNPESSNRLRVLFRKTYRLERPRLGNTYSITDGTATCVDPALNYTIHSTTQSYVGSGYGVAQRVNNGTCVHIDEIVNLCGLPMRARHLEAEPFFEIDGGITVCVYGSSVYDTTDGNGHQVLMNTRINMTSVDSEYNKFY